ncbi:MAG: HAMP domain-containing histidine kinase [Candidatus Schekmanbacteria bacterium]|nr:HAMP domain-containing histidine kinase [Candidatus Schekmanbacteria bacterium]
MLGRARVDTAFAALRRFASDASHELRTPLARLRTDLEVTLAHPRAPEAYREALERAVDETIGLSEIVSRVLELARLESHAGRPQLDVVDLRDLIDDVTELAAPLLEQRRLDIRVEGVGDLRVQGDRQLLRQLLWNLIDNAIKLTGVGDRVTVSVEALSNRRLLLAVADNGPGIAREDLPHVGRPFFRATLGGGKPGHGLGLALCDRIARAHGSRLQIESPVQGSPAAADASLSPGVRVSLEVSRFAEPGAGTVS